MENYFISPGSYDFSLSGGAWAWIYVPDSDKHLFVGFEGPWIIPWPSSGGKFEKLKCLVLTLETHAENSNPEGYFKREISPPLMSPLFSLGRVKTMVEFPTLPTSHKTKHLPKRPRYWCGPTFPSWRFATYQGTFRNPDHQKFLGVVPRSFWRRFLERPTALSWKDQAGASSFTHGMSWEHLSF